MIQKKLHILLAGLLLASCSAKQYQLIDGGVVVNIKQTNKTDTRKVRLQVMHDELIHVSATPDKEFRKDSTLIIVPGIKNSPFTVDNSHKDSIMVLTSRLKVMVSKLDGGVIFKDKDGKLILAEKKGGGKTFTPIEVESTKGFSVRQIFNSPADEAFHGLGQHQADEFNYKGKSEELFQYNTKSMFWNIK